MRSLWPFWSFWSPDGLGARDYDHVWLTRENPASPGLPDPGFPGRDHLAVGADRRSRRRLAGRPGAGPPVRAALACDCRIRRDEPRDPGCAAPPRPRRLD